MDERQKHDLPINTLFTLEVASEIRDVGCHCGPAASDGGHGGEDQPRAHGAEDGVILVPDLTGTPSLLGHGDDDADASDAYDHCCYCQNMGLTEGD